MTPTTVALAEIVTGVLIALSMIIWLLRHVYDRGGPTHVLDVAKALRQVYDPKWPLRVLGYLPNSDKTNDEEA